MADAAAISIYDSFMEQLASFMIDARIVAPEALRGCAASDIHGAEARLGRSLPLAFAAAVRKIGVDSGTLMDGDFFGLDSLETAGQVAREITSSPECAWHPTPTILPFLEHQGYSILFIPFDQGDDPPVSCYMEGNEQPSVMAPTFTAWIRETALSRVEFKPWNDEICREIADARESRSGWLARKAVLDREMTVISSLRNDLIKRVAAEDQQCGAVTGPLAFQARWNDEIVRTDFFRKMLAEGRRMPWEWRSLDEVANRGAWRNAEAMFDKHINGELKGWGKPLLDLIRQFIASDRSLRFNLSSWQVASLSLWVSRERIFQGHNDRPLSRCAYVVISCDPVSQRFKVNFLARGTQDIGTSAFQSVVIWDAGERNMWDAIDAALGRL